MRTPESFSDWNAVPIEPRSRLYTLEPYQSHDGLREGLLSYLVRLARAHCLRPRDLIRLVLADGSPDIKRLCYNSFYVEYANTVNGLGRYARLIADRLNELTGRQDLDELTMLPWSQLVPDKSECFIARTRRWCPQCLDEQLHELREVFWPLAWSLESYRTCHRHSMPMQEHCPHCGSTQDFVPSVLSLMHCGKCGGSLAEYGELHNTEIGTERTIVELLRNPNVAKSHDLKASFKAELRKVVDSRFDGNRAAMCRAMHWNAWALKGWLDQDKKVSFPKLIDLLSTHSLLVPGVESHSLERVSVNSSTNQWKRSPRPILTLTQRAKIRDEMHRLLRTSETTTLSKITRTTGLSRSTLRYWFPNECNEVTTHRKKSMESSARLTELERENVVRRAFDDLISQGYQVTRRAVDRQIRKAGLTLARPEVRKVFERVRQSSDLG